MAYGPFREVRALAEAIAAGLFADKAASISGSPGDCATIITEVIDRNFATEAAINREVETQLTKLGSQTSGMDLHKLREGLRARLAKEKGFVL